MKVRYYSTHRPLMPGSFPTPRPYDLAWDGVRIESLENFDFRKFVPEICREAWGYIEYSKPIPKDEADAYELLPYEEEKKEEERPEPKPVSEKKKIS